MRTKAHRDDIKTDLTRVKKYLALESSPTLGGRHLIDYNGKGNVSWEVGKVVTLEIKRDRIVKERYWV